MTAQELSQRLIDYIGVLVDGNQVKASDVSPKSLQSTEFTTQINVFWTFIGENKVIKRPGNHASAQHFNSYTALQENSQKLCEQLDTDLNLRENFLELLKSNDDTGLTLALSKQTFYDFGSCSASETCSNCKGHGENTCSDCHGSGKCKCSSCSGSGKKTCPRCHGSVYTTIYINNKPQRRYCGCGSGRVSCSSCSGSGKKRCHNCGGTGCIRCQPCEGFGVFTHIHHVTGTAQPSFSISTDCNLYHESLLEHLKQGGIPYTTAMIEMKQVNNQSIDAQQHLFTYQGQSIAIAQQFSLKNQDFLCCAFGLKPQPYLRPHIFDSLFADELTFLEESTREKKSRQTALQFFQRYTGQPVLDKTMQNIAVPPDNNHNKPDEYWLIQATDQFISTDFARRFTTALKKILNTVSPQYSSAVWIIISVITSLLILFNSENLSEQNRWPISSILGAWTFLFILTTIIAFIISTITVLIQRRHIPPAYRQKPNNWKPFIWFTLLTASAAVTGMVYGNFTHNAILPAWKNYPLNYLRPITNILTNIPCRSSAIAYWGESWCNLGKTHSPTQQTAALKKTLTAKQTSTITKKPLTTREKIRFIQQTLQNAGYPVHADGIYGIKTRTAAVDYLRKHGKNIKDLDNINFLYKTISEISSSNIMP